MNGRIRSRLVAAALFAWGLGSIAGAEDPYGVRIQVDKPVAGSVVRGRTDMAPLSGVASSDGARPSHFDVMLVVDVSGSTKYPSGVDVDGDGDIGETRTALMAMLPDVANTDPEDSVLAAEAQASNALIDGLAPQRVRIGVVSFSGEVDPATGRRKSPDQQDAFLEQPLTNDFTAVRRALEAVVLRGASGGTNMQAGLTLATRELAGLQGAQSEPKRGAKPVILLLTDGKPSLPYGLANAEDEADIEAVIDAARVAKTAGIVHHFFTGAHGRILLLWELFNHVAVRVWTSVTVELPNAANFFDGVHVHVSNNKLVVVFAAFG